MAQFVLDRRDLVKLCAAAGVSLAALGLSGPAKADESAEASFNAGTYTGTATGVGGTRRWPWTA